LTELRNQTDSPQTNTQWNTNEQNVKKQQYTE